jgi:predicted AAA+ superfamily ATPase
MAPSNHERIGRALELLNAGLMPFFERELRGAYGDQWQDEARLALNDPRQAGARREGAHWDTTAMLGVMIGHWQKVFSRTLGQAERSLIGELRDTRNRWAHQQPFTVDDTYRAFDSIQRLLMAISAPEAAELDRQKQEILRLRFEELTRREQKKVATAPLGAAPAAGLRPWRDIITPHPDVASGRYQQAEFAADLGQVHRGEGTDEYRDPKAFFQRTFLTEGLRRLLVNALLRLTSSGGDPVVELQTNFGGGKTHSMLALYHLCAGLPLSELVGLDVVLQEAKIARLPSIQRAVIVGTALSPGQSHRKKDGTVIHTLWGELAYQLLGRDGYALVAAADQQGVSPGSDILRTLFDTAAPCLILIDEWVAYVRQLYGTSGLPGGSFDANMTFAQALTEAARAVPHVLIVASLPASDIEIGGEGGREALGRLRNTFGRIESSWRPASTEEGFEIVRRRLFQPIGDPSLFTARDTVVKAYMDLYRSQPGEFPSECREADFERRLKAAYPIHPELFDRLYNDWSTLDKFQRTRGVLRLMAAVIHSLWERQDRSLLIMPASIPVDDDAVQFELTRYLEDPWVPVIEKDVDGPNSLPLRIDRDNPNLGRYSAARRVARTLYLGSAPTLRMANKGLEDRRIKLGCVQPGEAVSTFGDALRRLIGGATHLYENGQRYWFSTQPSVNRLAQDRAEQQKADDVEQELVRRLREELKQRGDFAAVHLAPSGSHEVVDEREVRLVVLGPAHPHSGKQVDTAARQEVQKILDSRGTSPRRYKNAIAFLAPDRTRLDELDQAVRQYLAWKSIEDERTELNLDAFQESQTRARREQADETVKQRIPEAYIWLLVPAQQHTDDRPDPFGEIIWEETRLQGADPLAVRAAKRMKNDGMLITQFGGIPLRMELDKIPLWRGEHVSVKQLAEDFAQYLYLPRLRDSQVVVGAIEQGLGLLTWEHETFAYAERFDADSGRYNGLRAGQTQRVTMDDMSVVVRPEAARRQLDADEAERQRRAADEALRRQEAEQHLQDTSATEPGGTVAPLLRPAIEPSTLLPKVVKQRRYHGAVRVEPLRITRDASQIADAIVQHLASLPGAKVCVTIEIEAEIPDGAPEHVVRTVIENSRTLKFESSGFEEA